MKQEDDKLRNLLQDVFSDYEEIPEPEDWNRIASSLQKAKSRRILLWPIWTAAAVILLLLSVYTGNEFITNKPRLANDQKINSVTNTQHQAVTIKSTATIAKQKPDGGSTRLANQQHVEKNRIDVPVTLKNGIPKAHAEKPQSVKSVAVNEPMQTNQYQKQTANNKLAIAINQQSVGRNNPVINATTESSVPKTDVKNASIVNPTLAVAGQKKISDEDQKRVQKAQEQLNALKENHEVKQVKSDRTFILTGLALGNSSGFQPPAFSTDQAMYSNSFSSAITSGMYLNSVKIYDLTSTSSPNISSLYQNIERNFKPPISVALSATFSLGSQFSLESGLQYTRLVSNGEVTIKSANDVQFITYNTYDVNEVLHYVGIPIMVNYTFVGKKRLNVFISSGLTFEKGIRANYNAVSKNNIPGIPKITSHEAIKGIQESFSGGIGLSYSFIPHFELYIQPSLTYYFKSAESNATIYSVNPWLINLRSGIRYNFNRK